MALDNDNTWLYLADSLVVQFSRSGVMSGDVTSDTLFISFLGLVNDFEVGIIFMLTFGGIKHARNTFS